MKLIFLLILPFAAVSPATAADKSPLPPPWIETDVLYGGAPVGLPAPHASVRTALGLSADCNVAYNVDYDPAVDTYVSEGVEVVGIGQVDCNVRLAGPTYNWPGCGARWCNMCVGIHLRSSAHGESYQYLNALGSAGWVTHHDNLHNSGRAHHSHSSYATTGARIETETRTTTISATRWRLFGRRRR